MNDNDYNDFVVFNDDDDDIFGRVSVAGFGQAGVSLCFIDASI